MNLPAVLPETTDLGQLEQAIRAAVGTARRASVEVARMLWVARDTKLVAERSWTKWAVGVTGLSRSVVSRLATAERLVRALPAALRDEADGLDRLRLYAVRDALADDRAGEAIELVKSEEPERALIAWAADASPDQHRERGWFDFTVRLPESMRVNVERMENKARFQSPTRYGDRWEFFEWLLGLAETDEYNAHKVLRPHEIAEHAGDPAALRRLLGERIDAIEAGIFGCELWGTDLATPECAGLDWSADDEHHLTAVSVGGRKGRTMRVCRWCHQAWQPRAAELREALGIEREGW